MEKVRKKSFNGRFKKGITTVFITIFLVSSMFVPLDMMQEAKAHTGDKIRSPMTTTPPTIDGNFTPGEWNDAVMIDLTTIPGNMVGSYMYVMNNDTCLFILYDAFGDNTNDPMDGTAAGFDTNHDGVNGPNDGDDDYFYFGGPMVGEGHYDYNMLIMDWQEHCSPFSDPGLAAAMGFNTTPNSGSDHRIYEWSIPLDQLDASLGDIIGFAAGCQLMPGVYDADSGNYDQWPVNLPPIPLDQYGNLIIGGPYNVDIKPEKQTKYGLAGQETSYKLRINNTGINPDIFDLTYLSSLGWSVTFYDASWNPLVDNGGGPEVDTGSVAAKTSVVIHANISVPLLANPGDIDITIIQGNSSGDPTVNDTTSLRTQVVYNIDWFDGFEAGWDAWTAQVIRPSFPSPTIWEIGDPSGTGPGTAFNYTNCSGTNINDAYYMNADICLISPYVQLGSGYQILSFYQWYYMDTMGDDGGFVEISVNDNPWVQIWPDIEYPWVGGYLGGYNTDGYSGISSGWEYDEYDLSPYANQVVRVRFHFAASDWHGGDDGWYIDDVFMGSPPPYRLDLEPDYQIGTGNAGTDVSYVLTVTNNGADDDAYDLSSGGTWGVTIRDITDTWDIFSIFVASGNSADFIAKVTIPGLASPGDFDVSSIKASSQNDTSKSEKAEVETNVPEIPPWFDDMEFGPGWWKNQTDGDGTEWQLGDPSLGAYGPPKSYSPINCWGTNIASNYTIGGECNLTTAYIDLTWAANANLSFWHWYDINGFWTDGGWVEVSDDYGSTWIPIEPLGGYPDINDWGIPCYAGSSVKWIRADFDLSDYTGSVIQLRFHFLDADWDGVERAGWYVDDIMIYASKYGVDIEPNSFGFGDAGDTVEYILTVTNTGDLDDSFTLSVSGNTWPTTIYDSTGTFVITNTGFLGANNSIDIMIKVDIPIGANPGDFDISKITATSDNDTGMFASVRLDTNYPVMPLWFDDMESGKGGWRPWNNNRGTSWQLGNPSGFGPGSAYSLPNCWGTNLVTDYTTSAEATLRMPYLDLRLAQEANLTFMHWYDINGVWNDGGWVEVSLDNGQTWMRIYPEGGYPDIDGNWFDGCYAGTTAAWTKAEFNLTAFVGNIILIRFRLYDYMWDGPMEGAGWYIDDVNVSATYLAYGVDLTPDIDSIIASDGTSVLYLMTATNMGTAGPDTFNLNYLAMLGWSAAFYDLSMTPITSVGPIDTSNSMDFYVNVTIPIGELPGTIERTIVIATSQNDSSFPPADDNSFLFTQVLAPILFVDDDGGIDTEANFTTALDDGGYSYNVWNYQVLGELSLSDLQQHEVIIWGTGNTEDDLTEGTLTPTDRMNLGNYLDGGGRLYLSSSLAGADAVNYWSGTDFWLSWYQTYLHSDFVDIFGGPSTINGVTSDPISDGLNYNLYQGDYNPNLMQVWTHHNPVNDGITFFTEPWPSNVATRADTGTNRVVYTGFDFSAVDGVANRATLMDRILKWLLFGDLPYVIETDPTHGASGIVVDQDVVVIYSESMNTSVEPTLSQVGGPDPGGWTFSGWSTTYITDDTATWTHNSWSPSQTVNMSVSGGEDLEGNSASEYLFNFTIVASADPWAFATGPTSTGTNATLPQITYNFGNSPTNVQIYWSNDGGSTWNMWGSDNSVDGSWTPGSPLSTSGTYYWSARAMGGSSEPPPSGPGDIEAGPYVLDIDAPTIFSTDPVDGATDVSTAAGTYVIEFSEPMSLTGTDPLSNLPGIMWTWDSSGLWLNGTYTVLSSSTTYYVNLTDRGFIDAAGNHLTGDMYKNFTTMSVPWATATGPTSSGTNVSTPTITYDQTDGPTSVEIYWSDNGGTTWNLWGTDSSVDGSWSPGSPLPASGTYYWSARAIGPPSESVPIDFGDIEAGTYVLDIDSPTIISTTPLDEATGVSTAAGTYIIEFIEPMALTGTDPLSDLPGVSWSWDPLGLWLNGTYTALSPGTTYYVNLTDLGFTDAYGNHLTGDMYKNFTTTSDPWATATGPTSSGTNDTTPTITYDQGNGPTSVEIYWSDDGGASWNLWGTDTSVDGSWTPGSPLPASGTYYWSARAIGIPNETIPSGVGDIEADFYVLDIDGPTTFSTTPADGATGVDIAAGTYVIQFSEPMTLVGTPDTNLSIISWIWDPSGLWLNGTYTGLISGATYYVNLTDLGFTDAYGNHLTGDMYKNFTTAVGVTTANATGPIGGPTNVAAITIIYTTAGGPATVDLYYTMNTTGPYIWTLIGTDISVDGNFDWTIPADGSYGWLAVSPDEPAPTSSDAPEAFWYIYDGTPPEVVSTDPVNMTTSISVGQDIVITFNETMNNVTFTYTIEPSITGLLEVWSGGNTILTISHDDFPTGTRIWVNISVATDLAGNNLRPRPYWFYFDTDNSATVTGPITVTPTNDDTVTITYTTTGNPISVDLYYTTNLTAPYTWTFMGTDDTPENGFGWLLAVDGSYGWFANSTDELPPTSTDAPEASYYIYDGTPPEVESTIPANKSTGVPINQDIVITFNETMDIVTFTYQIEPTVTGLIDTWSALNSILTISHDDFALDTRYWVNITYARDLAGNFLDPYPLPYSIYFDTATTGAEATGPVGGPTNVSDITITYNTIGGPSRVYLWYTTNTTAPYTWIHFATDDPADGSYDWTITSDGYYGWLANSTDELPPTSTDAPESSWYIYDGTPPAVNSTNPVNATIDVLTTQDIVITFNETINNVTFTYTIEPSITVLSEVWNNDDKNLTITHDGFVIATRYWVNITAAMDLAGNNMVPYSFYFDTTTTDIVPPTVMTGTPTGSSVLITSNIVITFDEAMNTTSVNNAFSFNDGITTWDISDGMVSWNVANTIMTFNPTVDFGYYTQFNVTIDGSIAKDEAGNTLDGNDNGTSEGSPIDDYTWQFTTESAPPPDTTPPTSSVSALPTYHTSLSFSVSYTATDTQNNVMEVELWFKKDSGEWNLYNTYSGGSNTVTFTADSDGVYYFYTRARDDVVPSNYETEPSSEDAFTTVDTTLPTVDSGSDTIGNSQFTRDATASDAGSGIATYSWTMVSGPGTITFGTPSAEDTTISADTDGTYVIRLTVTDNAGHSASDEFTLDWDATPPTVSSKTPTGTNISITSLISITFSETVIETSVENAFTFTDGTTTWSILNGSATWADSTMTFDPDFDLSHGTAYTVNIGSGVIDTSGNTMTPYHWTFSTAEAVDTTAPTVAIVNPVDGAVIDVTKTIIITFSEAMNKSSVEAAISISPDATISDFSWEGNTLTITLESDLEAGKDYTVTIGTGAKDAAGNALEEPYTWQFTTEKAGEKEPEEDTSWLFILLIVIVIIVILLLLFLMKKKKPEEEERPPEGLGEGAVEEEMPEETPEGEGAEVEGEEGPEGIEGVEEAKGTEEGPKETPEGEGEAVEKAPEELSEETGEKEGEAPKSSEEKKEPEEI
ncbi:MAG: Ig-like domain-containing protein [Thermoplasmata archaeon]|nr:MAG: Ig-like domain-containing protein [Thermoplasmata archaeon]